MTANELLLELMRLTLEGKGDYKIKASWEYELKGISKVGTLDCCQTATLEVQDV